jgi:hypothetical protein
MQSWMSFNTLLVNHFGFAKLTRLNLRIIVEGQSGYSQINFISDVLNFGMIVNGV